LVIASDVPRRVSRGHREMMIVRSDDRVIVETLLDAGSDPVAINLDGLSHRQAVPPGISWSLVSVTFSLVTTICYFLPG
jgi:hypothetical protein